MKRFVALCLMAVAFATAPAFGDFQKGIDALGKGNYKTAFREFRPLAEQGDAVAQFQLGWMYYYGQGGPQNYKQAVEWWKLSAEQGNANAQYFLGIMYSIGHGAVQNYVRAHMWFNLAASNGSEKSLKHRDVVAKDMTDAQIEKAQDLAYECVAKDYKGC